MHDELKTIFSQKTDLFTDILGQQDTKKGIQSALLMGRHVVVVGSPGIGKTTLAKNVAKLLPEITVNACDFHCSPDAPICPQCKSGKTSGTKKIPGLDRFVRVQGSPDLTVEDLLGDIDPVKAMEFGPTSIEAFTPGKIFLANQGILFFDEVNRAPEKLQNALLQVLEEGIATIGSYTIDIPANFLCIATMNPQDSSATEPLSDVFLDRFDMVTMGYPERLDTERKIVQEKGGTLDIDFPPHLLNFTLGFVRSLRDSKHLDRFPSVRATLGLYERAQSNAFLSGRNGVIMDDIADAMVSVLAHRISLKPAVKYLQSSEQFIGTAFETFLKEHPPEEGQGGDG